MRTRYFAPAASVFIIIIGILGFIPKLLILPASVPMLSVSTGYGYLFSLFPVNLLLKLVYVAVGV